MHEKKDTAISTFRSFAERRAWLRATFLVISALLFKFPHTSINSRVLEPTSANLKVTAFDENSKLLAARARSSVHRHFYTRTNKQKPKKITIPIIQDHFRCTSSSSRSSSRIIFRYTQINNYTRSRLTFKLCSLFVYLAFKAPRVAQDISNFLTSVENR